MDTAMYLKKIIDEIKEVTNEVSAEECDRFAQAVISAGRIFVAGAGRSGLMMRAFAMRLRHMGLHAFVVGETVTPGIDSGDLLIIGSGSGETGSLHIMAQKAKKLGAHVALLTIFPQSSIGKLADYAVCLPAQSKSGEVAGTKSLQPMGSLFEQSLLLVLDAVVLMVMEQLQMTPERMFDRHANLE